MSVAPDAVLSLDAKAKLNLYLRVLGRRPDGYHEIRTLFQTLELCDTLTAERTSKRGVDLQITSEIDIGSPVSADADNLVCRAGRVFLDLIGADFGLRFALTKCIPAGGGLGGGSSDAAAALRLANALAGEPLDVADLHGLARQLGADVPFFLRGGCQLGTGVGDVLTEVCGAPSYHFLLLLSGRGTSTPAVYQNLGAQLTDGPPIASIPPVKVLEHKELALPMGFPNDLQAAACGLHPELEDLRLRTARLGHPGVRMTGSGSAFFLAFTREGDCVDAMAALDPLRRDRGVVLLRTRTDSEQHDETRAAPSAADWPDN